MIFFNTTYTGSRDYVEPTNSNSEFGTRNESSSDYETEDSSSDYATEYSSGDESSSDYTTEDSSGDEIPRASSRPRDPNYLKFKAYTEAQRSGTRDEIPRANARDRDPNYLKFKAYTEAQRSRPRDESPRASARDRDPNYLKFKAYIEAQRSGTRNKSPNDDASRGYSHAGFDTGAGRSNTSASKGASHTTIVRDKRPLNSTLTYPQACLILNISNITTVEKLQDNFEEIRRSYRRLSLAHHPDKPLGTVEKMAEINGAFGLIELICNAYTPEYWVDPLTPTL